MNTHVLIGVGIFFATILAIEGFYYLLRSRRKPEQRRIRRHLSKMSSAHHGSVDVDIARRKVFSNIPWLHEFLRGISPVRRLDHLLEGAGSRHPPGYYLLLGGLFAALVFMAGSLLTLSQKVIVPAAFMAALSPLYFLRLMKKRRTAKFQRQLPEALELVARALKAGHAFTSGMKMAADEFDDPIGTEFSKTIDEINFGVGIQDALRNLARRIDCPDLDFFVVSVIIQRETGGNLAEIIERIGHLIRERFKLFGLIKTLSAEGRISAIILVLVPFVISFYFYVVQPSYIELLLTDPLGRVMSTVAVLSMITGVFIMRRMIRFKV
jgi:tight adherence protein B